MESKRRSDLIPVGEPAPDFTAEASDGTTVRLSDLRGKKRVALVFYPGDDTPTCTAQLCAFRDDWDALQAEDTLVFGINPFSQERHRRFVQKYHFPFPLLADKGGQIAGLYGCRLLFGLLIRRTVYVVDKTGRIIYAQRGNPSPADIRHSLRAYPGESEPY